MSLRLHTLRFIPNGPDGWETPQLGFGRVLTLVLGANGTGKTPVLKAIAYGLGHAVELPPDVRQQCASVRLELVEGKRSYVLERSLAPVFSATATEPDGKVEAFSNEKDFAAWLLARLGIVARHLLNRNGQGVVAPYMGVLVPMFWIDQDIGWRNLYCPPHNQNFLKDQPEEVVRWLLALPSRSVATDKSEVVEAEQRHASLQERIAIRRKTIHALAAELGGSPGPDEMAELARRKGQLADQLEAHSAVLEAAARRSAALEHDIREAEGRRDTSRQVLAAAEMRLANLNRVGEELTAETEVLESNEVAADAFRKLCPNADCQFFRRPEESYGRRVLYLKDQLKDFATASQQIKAEIEALRAQLASEEASVSEAQERRRASVAVGPSAGIVAAVEATTRTLVQVETRLERVERFVEERRGLDQLADEEAKAHEEAEALRHRGGKRADTTRVGDVRSALKASFAVWLETLRTQNVHGSPTFDEHLNLFFEGERFTESSSYSGSTRTRIVLAFHAALLETSIVHGGQHPGFLVMDAPKQHELHSADLGAFVARFRQMARTVEPPIQLVIGATADDFVDEQAADVVWRPGFETPEGARFLGRLQRSVPA